MVIWQLCGTAHARMKPALRLIAIRPPPTHVLATVVTMKVEVLYFDGCPNHDALLPHLRKLLSAAGTSTEIELLRVEDADVAERERFLGSPTVRIGGKDVEPHADQRSDFGLKCRLYATPDGLRGVPTDEWVLTALKRAKTPSS